MLETNIDDMNPEFYQYIEGKLFKKGALDVFMTPIIMKKQRPGVMLSVLCNKKDADMMKDIIFKESTTFGIRQIRLQRERLKRDFATIHTEYGDIRVKNGYLNGQLIKSVPEYEDVKRAAEKSGMPIKDIYNMVYKDMN